MRTLSTPEPDSPALGSRPSVVGRSAGDRLRLLRARRRGVNHPPPPAIPKGGACRSPGAGERGGGRPGSGCCDHRCGRARRAAPGARRGARCPRSPLARARRSESRGCSLGGRRAAGTYAAAGRGLAAEALASMAGARRCRLGGDRPDRHCGRDRDEDQNLRRAPSRSSARADGLAVPTPAKVGPPRRSRGHVRCSPTGRRTSRAPRSHRVDRPVDARSAPRGSGRFRPAFNLSMSVKTLSETR